ncbi:YkgJ family cysteine cluster protein [Sediminibacillus albus]|uniref:Fe-S-cluster containining protein n=1 Tax=Sediminibacillus albus TaxID=407036 RepID=A0A1G8WM15_9BACI|nr:YkgJ family cysteine cluster protein [Sediminibacillus albus]SDJ78695.1 Fe-S-cluster containining protein [Sediminibacillus albus]
MGKFLTYQEIQDKCEQLHELYQINEEKFYKVVEKWANHNTAPEQKLLASFQELLEVVSDEVAGMEEAMEMAPTCRLGCAFCCYFPIIVNQMEAKLMEKTINHFPEQRRHEIQDHINGYFAQYGEKIEQLNTLDFDSDADFKQKYKQSLLPCVMLNTETNQCMAYEIRPIPCRTYVNYTDPEVCEQNEMPKDTVSYEFLYSEYMGALNEFLQFLYGEGDTAFIDYPNDVYAHDYLANWFWDSKSNRQ